MIDDYFSKRVYAGTYEPVFRFAEFGDEANYWIRLKYYVNRDDYQRVKQTRGAPLDFGLKNIDGEAVFGDIPAAHLSALKSRNYVLGAQSPAPANEEGDLLLVTETYVYAPKKTYVVMDSDVVPIWGLEDPDYASSSPLVIGRGAGHHWDTDFYHNTILAVTNPERFNTGDYVYVKLDCWYMTKDILGALNPWRVFVSNVHSGVTRILRKVGNKIEISGTISFDVPYKRNAHENRSIHEFESFFQCLNGQPMPSEFNITLQPYAGKMIRAHSTRVYKKRRRPIREEITFSVGEPDLTGREIFVPHQQSGLEFSVISRQTIPSPAQWRAKIARGDWFQYAEPEPSFDRENGVYELRVKKTKCI